MNTEIPGIVPEVVLRFSMISLSIPPGVSPEIFLKMYEKEFSGTPSKAIS